VDVADAGGGLRVADLENAVGEIDVAPSQVASLADPEPGEDEGCDEGAIASTSFDEDRNFVGLEPGVGASVRLDAPSLALGRVPFNVAVLDGVLEDLRKPRQRLVDRDVRERAIHEARLSFSHLRGAVPVHFLDRDRGEPVVLEEREQMVRERPCVVLACTGSPLALVAGIPLAREDVECRLDRGSFDRLFDGRLPDAAADIGERILELGLGAVECPALVGSAEGDIATFAVSAEPQRVGAAVFAVASDDLAGGLARH
jgi:hypothetical protein